MADTYGQGSFAFRCLRAQADLPDEAIRALNAIMMEDEPEVPSAALTALCPPTRPDKPWSGLIDLMADPECPGIHADCAREIAPDDPGLAIICFSSMDDVEASPLAHIIHLLCRATLQTR